MLAVMAAMTGTTVASTEVMSSSFDGTYFQTSASNLLDTRNGHYYVLRYYPPETLPCNTDDSQIGCEAYFDGLADNYVPPNYIPGTPHYSPQNFFNEQSSFTPTEIGWWVITLWHSGSGTDGKEICIKSFKLWTPVNVPIPEFSTVAIPIAAVLGLVFFFQHRKRKEE